MSDERRRSFLGLSWFQVIAGALAAMTSAWIASTLGVAGTIIGAAVGSLVATITSALYVNTLDRSRTLIVRTDSGTVVETTAEPGDTVAALNEVREVTGSQVQGAEVIDEPARQPIHFKTIGVTTLVVLVLAIAAMGGYELITGRSYGADPNNSKIGNPFGHSSTKDPSPSIQPTDPSPTDTLVPTDPTPTSTEPTDTAATPTVPTPTISEPSPDPTE